MAKKEFFPHIAGLRGLALLFVLLFHLNGTQWANGYLGVEVFLVIMGYLIFKARVDRGGNDTLKQCAGYLMKRVRRIVPPMLVVILTTLSIGVFIFSPTDQSASVQLGHEACLLQANIHLKHAFANYFAPSSKFMPLLPLWYLSVAQAYFDKSARFDRNSLSAPYLQFHDPRMAGEHGLSRMENETRHFLL